MLRTFETEEDLYENFKKLCAKEKKKVGAKINELMEKEVKEHGDGNPQFTLEQFEDPNFIACPAFYRDATAWSAYMAQATPEELEKIKNQIITIDHKLAQHI